MVRRNRKLVRYASAREAVSVVGMVTPGSWTTLKLKAIPAMRWTIGDGVDRLQVSLAGTR